MPSATVEIIQQSLHCRLGSSQADAQEVMAHKFFSSINWKDVREKKVSFM